MDWAKSSLGIDPRRPIALFDSGFGGLTILKEAARLLPSENFIYLGDTAHVPYGNKSPETIIQLAFENASFLIEKGAKLLIVACHTACCHALEQLEKRVPIPVVGVIQPLLKLIQGKEKIALLATEATLRSGIYQSLIQKEHPNISLFPRSCPLFVPLIEEGLHLGKEAEEIGKQYLEPLKGKIDGALLACTHYPLIKPLIGQILGPEIPLIEPGEGCALLVRQKLIQGNQLNSQKEKPVYQFYSTKDPEKFQKGGAIFFGSKIERVEKK